MFDKWFLEHPRTVGETYLEHMRAALGYGVPMIGGGVACLVHAVFPVFFTHTGSQTVASLHSKMKDRVAMEESDIQDSAATPKIVSLKQLRDL